jgi:hypothetical protein
MVMKGDRASVPELFADIRDIKFFRSVYRYNRLQFIGIGNQETLAFVRNHERPRGRSVPDRRAAKGWGALRAADRVSMSSILLDECLDSRSRSTTRRNQTDCIGVSALSPRGLFPEKRVSSVADEARVSAGLLRIDLVGVFAPG